MAQLRNLFEFTGSLGNVVGYYYRGKYCLRTKPVKTKRPLSPAQLMHQAKFKMASHFANSLSPLMAITFTQNQKMSGVNFVFSRIMKEAIVGNYPDFKIDYSKVPITCGRLFPAMNPKITNLSDNVILSWQYNGEHHNAKARDKTILIVYCEALNSCAFEIDSSTREKCIGAIPVAHFKGHKVHTWIAFQSADGKQFSNSQYTGSLSIS